MLKFADDTKLFRKVKEIGDKFFLQDDIDKLVKWSEKWQMLFNFGKCKCLHTGPGNTGMNYEMGGTILSKTVKEKDLGVTMNFSPFSPFAAVSLCWVAGLAQTSPFLTVGGPFLLDTPRFHVSLDRVLPPQLWSSSRALPLHLHFDNRSDVLGFVSSLDVAEPLQPSPSHNCHYLFHFRFL